MTQPHQCRCAICGDIGTIVPGLPNVLTPQQREYADKAKASYDAAIAKLSEPTTCAPTTCAHGYTVCNVCKFPSSDAPPGGMVT